MLFRLEKRPQPSRLMLYVTPVAALAVTAVVGIVLFGLFGFDGLAAAREIFITPIVNPLKWADLGIKAAPLILIGVGLSIAYRANVWNIGAEGQFVMGGVFATGIALATHGTSGPWILPLMALAGIFGGMVYASIPALLRTGLRVNEILTSLMLTYASYQLIYWLVNGPWKDPMGMGFPQTRRFTSSAILPTLFQGTHAHWGIIIALVVALVAWLVMSRSVFGYQIKVVGAAPHAAAYGGFSENRTIWLAMLISGGLAGLAGMVEVSGSFQRLVPGFPVGYGFTAIIVAFLGRLHPVGVILAGFVLAVTFVGGDTAQSAIRLPSAVVGIFQALMLFFLLASDILVRYRIRRVTPAREMRA